MEAGVHRPPFSGSGTRRLRGERAVRRFALHVCFTGPAKAKINCMVRTHRSLDSEIGR